MNEVTWTDIAQVGLVAAQLVVLAVAVIYARRQVNFARDQVNEARELREEQNRPFVVVDFDFEGDSLLFLEVVNMGTSLARDVRIEIDPPLESAIDIDVGKLKMLNKGIATMAPGKKYRTFFDMGFRRNEDSDLPMNYVATVTYSDEKGKRDFKETLNLDLDQYMNMHFVTRHGVHDVYKQLERIRKVFEKWGWSGGRGLVTMTPEESRQESKRMIEAMEERQERREVKDES